MQSSDSNNTSIGNVLLHAAVQLSVPTVSSTASITTKLRSSPAIQISPPTKKIRYHLSSLSISFPRRYDLNKRRIVRDIATQTITHKSREHLDNNTKPTMITALTPPSQEYVSDSRYYKSSRSYSCSSTKTHTSIKSTLLGIWQGLNIDESRSSTVVPTDRKYFDERVKKNTPSWKTFSKVVTSLLTFTRSKKGQYEWIQLVGHPGTFKEGISDGYILKVLCESERQCHELVQNDILKDFVPKYNGVIKDEAGKSFIEMEDLLASFHEPCIMDCKIGVRTYLEEELDKSERDPEARADLYNKMIAIDPSAPTEKENEDKKILKPRYMIWRESLSSSQDLGFRIEAIKKSHNLMSKEFQRIKERDDVKRQLNEFIANSLPRATRYLERLIDLRFTCSRSNFFQTHELIGSSLLFVHDGNKASIWMIDFGKTRSLPDGIRITHQKPWIRGTHEDGYLFGLDNLISILSEIVDEIKLTLNSI